jgi:hypothetical protein
MVAWGIHSPLSVMRRQPDIRDYEDEEELAAAAKSGTGVSRMTRLEILEEFDHDPGFPSTTPVPGRSRKATPRSHLQMVDDISADEAGSVNVASPPTDCIKPRCARRRYRLWRGRRALLGDQHACGRECMTPWPLKPEAST